MRRFHDWITRALVVGVILLAGACSSDKEEPYVEKPPERLYAEAVADMESGDYKEAARLFSEVERQHPYSQWSPRAQVMTAFMQYQAMEYDKSVDALDRFIQTHPGHSSIAYAYYLRALCFYERIPDVRRDQGFTEKALTALDEVVRRAPDTEYARDARLKMDLANDHLAGREMEVGRYYLGQKIPSAALGRFRRVVEVFQTTSHVPEALHRLVEVYLLLGLTDEAQATAAVLGHNFPGSTWYQDSFGLLDSRGLKPEDKKDSWIGRVWNKMARTIE
ncbi:MAG: outer membrane protein assembly factor BamD [Alphaproteobacteria bacterium]|nr:MAG: outer membrane protein assembly factor BamD [Alphaproteobacteria bacterium]